MLSDHLRSILYHLQEELNHLVALTNLLVPSYDKEELDSLRDSFQSYRRRAEIQSQQCLDEHIGEYESLVRICDHWIESL